MLPRLLAALCLLTTLGVAAQEQTEDAKTWSGEGALGYTSSSGNSDSTNLNASLNVAREVKRWKHSLSVEAIQNETDGDKSADRWSLRERSRYALDGKSYAFGQARYEQDKFSGYDHQGSLVAGLGSRFIENEHHLLDLSAGLGYRSTKDSDTGATDDGGIVTSDLVYEYKISKTATLSERALIEAGDNNTFIESETALSARLNGRLSSKISYLIKRNSEVPVDTEKTDTLVTIALVYAF